MGVSLGQGETGGMRTGRSSRSANEEAWVAVTRGAAEAVNCLRMFSALAVGLAGIGPARTQLEIWADPGVTRNVHEIHVRAEAANFRLYIENVPSEENPKTGKLVALSVIATLRRLTAPLVVGT